MLALELCAASLDQCFPWELKGSDIVYSGPMPTDIQVLLQLTRGLAYIHSQNITHRDIKPQNVLIGTSSTTNLMKLMKWADFGLSKKIGPEGSYDISGIKGTRKWMAPEQLKVLLGIVSQEKNYKVRGTVRSDLFSTGCLYLYFLKRGAHPYGDIELEIMNNVVPEKPIQPADTAGILYEVVNHDKRYAANIYLSHLIIYFRTSTNAFCERHYRKNAGIRIREEIYH